MERENAARNLQEHGIDFEDAIGVFERRVLEVRSDRNVEERHRAIGKVEAASSP